MKSTEKRYLVAVDVGSMVTFGGANGSPQIRPLLIAAAMAQLIAKTESQFTVASYSQAVTPICLTSEMTIQEVVKSLAEVTRQVQTLLAYLQYIGGNNKTTVVCSWKYSIYEHLVVAYFYHFLLRTILYCGSVHYKVRSSIRVKLKLTSQVSYLIKVREPS